VAEEFTEVERSMTDDWTEYFRNAAAKNAEQLKEQEMEYVRNKNLDGAWGLSTAELRQDEERRKNAAARNMLDAAWANRNTPTLDKLVGRDATGDARYAGVMDGDGVTAEWKRLPGFERIDVGAELRKSDANIKQLTADIIEGATHLERTRILASLQSLKPRIRPSHGDWARAWREEAALDMWNKVVALVGGEK
jgi:hypothetical protein